MFQPQLSALRIFFASFFLLTTLYATAEPPPAPPEGKPLAYLLQYVDQSPYGLWKTQPLQRRLKALLGPVEYASFVANLDPATNLTRNNNVLYVTGNAPHRGGEEEAAMLVDVDKDSIEVFLLHKSSIVRAWAENNRIVAIPKDVQEALQRWPRAPLTQALNTLRQAAATTNGSIPASGPTPAAAFAQTPRLCQTGTFCDEVSSFAATITDFRTSGTDRYKIVTATVRFTNKLNRPLILGLVQGSGVALDDQGNRYTVYGENNVRGIGLIVSDRFDPKFTLQPGESSDARIEFAFAMARNITYGTSWEANITVREIDPVSAGQFHMGREHELRFTGLANRVTARPGGLQAERTGIPESGPMSQTSMDTTSHAVPAAAPDACGGAPRCFSSGIFSATIHSMTASSVGNFHDQILRIEIKFRNVTDRPIILAYGAGTSTAIDNLGNIYYWGHAGTHDVSAQGIGISESQKANPQFVLQPGESRSAIFQVIRYRPGNQQIGTSFTYSATIQQLEILPSQQIRTIHDYSMTFPDLTPTGFNGTNVNDSIRKLGDIFGKKK